MLVNSIKIGLVVGAFAFTTLTVAEGTASPEPEIRVPESIDQASPPCLQMYRYIKQYADTFNIPIRYAFGIAYAETRYNGPFDWKYNPAQTSSAGAVGPMQVMVATAHWINKDRVSKDYLRTNIKYNVYTSMKLLRKLYNLRRDWKLVFGEYNTGRPCVNGYADFVYHHKINWKRNSNI
jgi:soluble lytic murein transglycosylase-like protein